MSADLVRDYIELVLALGRHIDGLVDAYYGPPELEQQVDAEEPVDPAQLAADGDTLAAELEDGWLRDQVRGCATYAHVLAGAEMTGTIKEYTPGTALVLETLAPSEPVHFKLSKTVTYADKDGKPIEAAGLTTNQKVRVHYMKVGGDNVADKVSLIGN